MSTAERKQFIDPSVLEAVKRLQRRDTAVKLAEALRVMVTAANVKKIDPLVMFVSIERARAALAEWDAQS